LLPLPFRRGEGWGEGLLRVVYPAVLAVTRPANLPDERTAQMRLRNVGAENRTSEELAARGHLFWA
ncbi:MAG: hypothetical protein WCK27_32840, partial [Verrucomicrobiota bacterium]